MKVIYVGQKAVKEDNVAGSGAVWMGHGDVQTVPDAAWLRLSRHSDVWRAAEQEPSPPNEPAVLLRGTVPIEGLGGADMEALAPQFFGVSETPAMAAAPKADEASAAAPAVAVAAAGALADAVPTAQASDKSPQFVINMVTEQGVAEPVVLDALDDVGLKAFAARLEKEAGLNIDLRKKGDKMREAIVFAWGEMLSSAKVA